MKPLLERIARYLAFLRWFLRDAFFRYRWRLIAVAAGSVIGLALQGAAFYLAFHYARALESDTPLQLLGSALPARSSTGLLVAVATAFLALIVGAALIIVRARLEGISIARDYGDFCSQRIYVLASRLPSAATPEANRELGDPRRVRNYSRREANFCGITLRILVRGLLPMLATLASAIALLALDAALSAILFLVLAAAAVFLYRISLRGAGYLALMKDGAYPHALERQALTDRLALSAAELDADDDAMATMFRRGATAKAGDAIVGQRQVIERSVLVAQIAMGCALFLILLVQGSATLRNESNWSALLAYLGVFAYFAANASNSMRILISVNRYYPSLGAYARFVRAAEPAAAPAAQALDFYRLEAPALDAPAAALEARRGERIALIVPGEVDRHGLTPLALALRGLSRGAVAAPIVAPWFATAAFEPRAGTLRDNFGLPASYTKERLDADLASLGLAGVPANIGAASLNAALRFVLATLSGIRGGRGVLVLDEKSLASLEPEPASRLLGMANDCLVFIAYAARSPRSPGSRGETALVVSDAERVVGWAGIESFRAGSRAVLDAIDQLRASAATKHAPGLDEDILDELA
jgi:hypothetical protein